MSRKKESAKIRLSKDQKCVEIKKIKLPIQIEIVPRKEANLPTSKQDTRKLPPSRIPVWIGRKSKTCQPQAIQKIVIQHQGPNDCTRSSFTSTPVLDSTVNRSTIKSYLSSTPNLKRIDEKKPLQSAKGKKTKCKKCTKNFSSKLPQPSCVCTKKAFPDKTQVSESYYLKSELGSRFLFPTSNTKITSLHGLFCSTPCLNKHYKSKSTTLHKLLASTTILSKQDKIKPQKDNRFKSMSLIDRSCLSQKEYMNMLSTPHKHIPAKCQPCQQPNCCSKYKIGSCPPRIVEMAMPRKNLVLANWERYQNVYSADQLERFQRILNSKGNDLEVGEARRYFEYLDKRKQKLKVRKKLCRDQERSFEQRWLKFQINETADAILEYFQNEPLYMLNFKEMVMSDEILDWLEHRNVIKIQCRSTKNVYKKTVIDICDKMVTWMNKLNYFVDLQAFDSKDQFVFVNNFSSDSSTSEDEGVAEEVGEELVRKELANIAKEMGEDLSSEDLETIAKEVGDEMMELFIKKLEKLDTDSELSSDKSVDTDAEDF